MDQVHDLHAVYVGPSSLLVNMWITPQPESCERPAAELLRSVDELRFALLAQPAITQVTIPVGASR